MGGRVSCGGRDGATAARAPVRARRSAPPNGALRPRTCALNKIDLNLGAESDYSLPHMIREQELLFLLRFEFMIMDRDVCGATVARPPSCRLWLLTTVSNSTYSKSPSSRDQSIQSLALR